MDEIFDQVHALAESLLALPAFPARESDLQVRETPREIIVYLSIPDARKEDIRVEATREALTIVSQSRRGEAASSVRRTVRLPVEVRAGEAKARYTEGLLRIALPKAEAAKPQRVRID